MKTERWLSVYGVALLAVIAFYRSLFGVRVIGRENVPALGGIIIAANHMALLDPPLMGAALAPRHLSYLAKIELFAFAPFAALISALNAFPVDRRKGDTAAIRKAVAILKDERALLVFPEGGRNLDGAAEAKNGVVLLARLSGVPVIPAYISGTHKAKFRRRMTVVFGRPRTYEASLGKSAAAMESWRDQLMHDIYALNPAAPPGERAFKTE